LIRGELFAARQFKNSGLTRDDKLLKTSQLGLGPIISTQKGTCVMAILSFNGRVNIAVRIVKEQYPKAALYEADGTASKGPTTDPAKIDKLRVVFRNENNTTVIITETGYGEFGKPQLIPHPWLEDIIIKWPIKMDLPDANKLKEEAGYTNPYANVTLRNPLGPTKSNPYFIFGVSHNQPYIFVDTVTGKVTQGS
jgi:hypothetical protein